MYAFCQFNSQWQGTAPKRVEENILLTEAHKDGSLASLLSFCWHEAGWEHSLFCGVWLILEQIFSKSFLCCLAASFPGSLTRKWVFVGAFSLCTRWHFWFAGFFSSNFGMYETRGKSPLCCSSKAEVSSQSESLHLSESS